MSGPAAIEVEIAELASALANPTRVQLLRMLLRRGPCTVGELVADLPLAQSTVSEHLRLLGEAGMVVRRRRGRVVEGEASSLTLRRLSSLLAGGVVASAPR